MLLKSPQFPCSNICTKVVLLQSFLFKLPNSTCVIISLTLLCCQLKSQWGDKYAEWMRETETKIQELQETNNMLWVNVYSNVDCRIHTLL